MEMHTRESLRAIHGIDGAARDPFSVGAWLSRVAKRMREAARRRRDHAILLEKSDRDLADIGLTRGDVLHAARHGGKLARRSDRGASRC